MRGMKIGLVLTLLLATNAFGGALLDVNPKLAVPNASGEFILSVSLNPDGSNAINGLGIAISGVNPGAFVVTSRRILSPLLTDELYNLPDWPAVGNVPLENVLDLGLASSDSSIGTTTAGVIEELYLKLLPGVPVPQDIVLTGTWADTNFDEGPAGAVTVSVPEPASMILLAAGAAFFARRRRVA